MTEAAFFQALQEAMLTPEQRQEFQRKTEAQIASEQETLRKLECLAQDIQRDKHWLTRSQLSRLLNHVASEKADCEQRMAVLSDAIERVCGKTPMDEQRADHS